MQRTVCPSCKRVTPKKAWGENFHDWPSKGQIRCSICGDTLCTHCVCTCLAHYSLKCHKCCIRDQKAESVANVFEGL